MPAWVAYADATRWLHESAPFCLLAHDTRPDPIFSYANQSAQRLFEYSWAEFMVLPSRLSAEVPNQDERRRLLEQVARQGFSAGYRGVRIARSGRRFWIEDATVWQVTDVDGTAHGQAAAIPSWRDLGPGEAA